MSDFPNLPFLPGNTGTYADGQEGSILRAYMEILKWMKNNPWVTESEFEDVISHVVTSVNGKEGDVTLNPTDIFNMNNAQLLFTNTAVYPTLEYHDLYVNNNVRIIIILDEQSNYESVAYLRLDATNVVQPIRIYPGLYQKYIIDDTQTHWETLTAAEKQAMYTAGTRKVTLQQNTIEPNDESDWYEYHLNADGSIHPVDRVTSINGLIGDVTLPLGESSITSVNGSVGPAILIDKLMSSLNSYVALTELTDNIGFRLDQNGGVGNSFIQVRPTSIYYGTPSTPGRVYDDRHNKPPYPVTSVNGQTGEVTVEVGVTSVNGKTNNVIVDSLRHTNDNSSLSFSNGSVQYRDDYTSAASNRYLNIPIRTANPAHMQIADNKSLGVDANNNLYVNNSIFIDRYPFHFIDDSVSSPGSGESWFELQSNGVFHINIASNGVWQTDTLFSFPTLTQNPGHITFGGGKSIGTDTSGNLYVNGALYSPPVYKPRIWRFYTGTYLITVEQMTAYYDTQSHIFTCRVTGLYDSPGALSTTAQGMQIPATQMNAFGDNYNDQMTPTLLIAGINNSIGTTAGTNVAFAPQAHTGSSSTQLVKAGIGAMTSYLMIYLKGSGSLTAAVVGNVMVDVVCRFSLTSSQWS